LKNRLPKLGRAYLSGFENNFIRQLHALYQGRCQVIFSQRGIIVTCCCTQQLIMFLNEIRWGQLPGCSP